VSPLDNPPSRLESWVAFLLLDFFRARFNVGRIVTPLQEFANVFRVVAFVETHMLSPCRWLRAMDWDVVESGFEKFDIVGVGATDRNTQGNAAGVS